MKKTTVKSSKVRVRRPTTKFVPREGAFVVEVIRRKSNNQRMGVLVGALLGGKVYIHGAKCRVGDTFDYTNGVDVALKRATRMGASSMIRGQLGSTGVAIASNPLAASLSAHLPQFVDRCSRYFKHRVEDIVIPVCQTYSRMLNTCGIIITSQQKPNGVKASPKQVALVEGREGR